MRALLTGATGFIGANLARRLVTDGAQVHLVVRQGARTWRLDGLESEVEVHTAALEDTESVRDAVVAVRPDVIFHLAVHGAYSFETDRIQMVRTNVLGTANLIEAALAAGCPVIVNTGSSSEYGDCDHAPAETEPVRPNSDYAVTKAASTGLAQGAASRTDLRMPTLRLYSVYGPWEDPRRLIPVLLEHAQRGTWPPLGPPWIVRDFVYVEDVVEAYLLAAQSRGPERAPIYNVGSGTQTTLAELVELSRTLFNILEPPAWGTYEKREWDVRTWIADRRKIEGELGWTPRRDLARGLLDTSEWMRSRARGTQAAGR